MASKKPRDSGWRAADYSTFDVEDWLTRGGNVGIRLRVEDVVIDVDPRNGGKDSFDALSFYVAHDR